MDSLASQAVVLLRNMVVDKPVILSEVGAVEAHHSGPSKLYESDTLGVLLHDLIFAPFFFRCCCSWTKLALAILYRKE